MQKYHCEIETSIWCISQQVIVPNTGLICVIVMCGLQLYPRAWWMVPYRCSDGPLFQNPYGLTNVPLD